MPQPDHVIERIQAAAGGDNEAFAELLDHHVPEAWGLAWAVALDRQAAAAALAEGFALALRTVRFQPERAGDFTSDLYREIYQAAYLRGQAVEVDPEQLATVDLGGLEAAPVGGPRPQEIEAFGGLPERWRAVLWLEACGFDTAAAPQALNVSPETAQRLLATAESALRQRLALAAEDVPAVLGPAILALAPAVPTNLPARAVRRWRGITLDQPTRWPVTLSARLGAGAWRPAAAACAVLLAFGSIGIGMLSDHHLVTSGDPPAPAAPVPSAGVVVPAPSTSRAGAGGTRIHRVGPAQTHGAAARARARAQAGAQLQPDRHLTLLSVHPNRPSGSVHPSSTATPSSATRSSATRSSATRSGATTPSSVATSGAAGSAASDPPSRPSSPAPTSDASRSRPDASSGSRPDATPHHSASGDGTQDVSTSKGDGADSHGASNPKGADNQGNSNGDAQSDAHRPSPAPAVPAPTAPTPAAPAVPHVADQTVSQAPTTQAATRLVDQTVAPVTRVAQAVSNSTSVAPQGTDDVSATTGTTGSSATTDDVTTDPTGSSAKTDDGQGDANDNGQGGGPATASNSGTG